MSDIRAKIKELEKLQKKVDFLKQVLDFPTKLKGADEDEKSVLPEVVEIVEKVLGPIIESLENGTAETIGTLGVANEGKQFSEEDISILMKIIERARQANPTSRLSDNDVKVEMPKKEAKKVSGWVLENQHLGGKRVKTMLLSNEIEGEVIQLREPFVVIKLDDGKLHQATLDKIKVMEE